NDGAIEPWTKPHYRASLTSLRRAAKDTEVRLDVPWRDLSVAERKFIVDGGNGYDGVAGFFRRLERKKYKVQVRVFLSRYRGYQTCPECNGSRLRRDALRVKVGGKDIDRLCALSLRAAREFLGALPQTESERTLASGVLSEIDRRLGYLVDIGL